jgi:hypothetical protein
LKSKKIKCSIFNLICHEFHCALKRRIVRDKDELEIFGHLTSAKNRFVKKITAYGGILVICAIAISNLSKGDGVDFRFGGVGVIIPEIYLVFVGASAFAGTIYLLLQVIVFLNVQAHYEHHIKPGNRFIGAELSLIGDENSDITGPIRVGHFFRLNNKFCTFSMITYLAPIFAAFLPFLASVTLLFEEALCGVLGSSDVFAGRLLSFVSLLLLILPTIYSVIFFVPVGTYKDKETINASFLARVTRR